MKLQSKRFQETKDTSILPTGRKTGYLIKIKLEIISRAMAETTIMVTVAITEITEVKVETTTWATITGLPVKYFTVLMTADMEIKYNMNKVNTENVRHYISSIWSVPGHYEQHCHVAMYQFQDLTISFGVNMPTHKSKHAHGTNNRASSNLIE